MIPSQCLVPDNQVTDLVCCHQVTQLVILQNGSAKLVCCHQCTQLVSDIQPAKLVCVLLSWSPTTRVHSGYATTRLHRWYMTITEVGMLQSRLQSW